MATTRAKTVQAQAADAVRDVNARLDQAEQLLEGFLERFHWIKDHPDFFEDVKQFLAKK